MLRTDGSRLDSGGVGAAFAFWEEAHIIPATVEESTTGYADLKGSVSRDCDKDYGSASDRL